MAKVAELQGQGVQVGQIAEVVDFSGVGSRWPRCPGYFEFYREIGKNEKLGGFEGGALLRVAWGVWDATRGVCGFLTMGSGVLFFKQRGETRIIGQPKPVGAENTMVGHNHKTLPANAPWLAASACGAEPPIT